MSRIHNFNISNLKSWLSVGNTDDYVLKCLKKMQTRRMTKAAKIVLDLAIQTSNEADVKYDYIVYASRHGELNLSYDLIQSILAQEIPSPIKFSQSTHNAIPGLYTINQKCPAPATAISAGAESIMMGLMAAVNYLKSNPSANILFMFTDVKVPRPYEEKLDEPNEDVMMSFLISSGHDFELKQVISKVPSLSTSKLASMVFYNFLLAVDFDQYFSSENFRLERIKP